MPDTIAKKLEIIEEFIRSARGSEARKKLLSLHRLRVPPAVKLRMASLARRANLADLGARILNPIVRPEKRMHRVPTDEDRVEYAACLLRLGACKEAELLLKGVDSQSIPQALLFLSMLRMKEKNYGEALKALRQYLRHPTLSQYDRVVGKINLALVLVYENILGEAKSVLSEVLEETSRYQYVLLNANALRFLGNLEMNRKEWEPAIGYFKASEKMLTDFSGLDFYFCRKWIAITHLYQSPNGEDTTKLIEESRQEAIRLRHWESLRDIDHHVAIATKNTTLFEHLYFGTPFESFKKKVQADWGCDQPPERYVWRMGEGPQKPIEIDIASEQKTGKGDYLKAGQAMHRLYVALTSDFYRPFNLVELYEKIFPDEHYCPRVSEFRVHQTIKRLRAWFHKNV